MSVISSAFCGNEHKDWLKTLEHYKTVFETCEKQLIEISVKYNSHDVLAWVEHFQNQFFLQRNNIDEVTHSIRVHDQQVSEDALVHTGGRLAAGLFTDHEGLKEEFYNIERVITDLRHEFSIFLAGKL